MIDTRPARRHLRANLIVPLEDYTNAPVALRLEDGDGTIAERNVGGLVPRGTRHLLWRFHSDDDGLQRVLLRRLRRPGGGFRVRLRANHWFDGARVGRAGDPVLTVTIGERCFALPASRVVGR